MDTELEILIKKHTPRHGNLYYWFARHYNHLKDWFVGKFINKPHIIKTSLPVTSWIDCDARLLYANMAVLMDFYEKEMLDENGKVPSHLCEEGDFHGMDAETIAQEKERQRGWDDAWHTMEEIALWWKNYENRQKEIDDLAGKGNDDAYWKAEHKLNDEEQAMLRKLVEVRGYMWT